MKTAILTAALALATALPAVAQDEPMPSTTLCGDYLTMTREQQLAGLTSLRVDEGEVGGSNATADASDANDAADTNAGMEPESQEEMEASVDALIAKCETNPNLMASQALVDVSK
ncbi:hypothetical protein [Oceaniglobus roseus]|uniref:hypothetical protein n=1 Tax=Oceaniglobus roseus TaxID=1737570 RepID=UPI000C7EDD80|nr:hypothetical protein [Kandeliimicrobium roseum]